MWGYHLSVDCSGCNTMIQDSAAISAFAGDMVRALDMKAFGAPQTVRFGSEQNVAGYTLVQLIETSNISAHFCDHTGEAYIDIFSCKKFPINNVFCIIEQHFAPTAYHHNYQERKAPRVGFAQHVAAE